MLNLSSMLVTNYQELAQDNDFHKWQKYEPLDSQYVKYSKTNSSVIAAGHKICDVYYAFANAKHSFRSADYKNYGDLCGDDEISRLYTKTHFLINSISEYALCLDLSWQVIWAYIQPSSFEYLMSFKHKDMEVECNRENLCMQLDCAISQNVIKATTLKTIMKDFDDDSDVIRLRKLNNSIKHHGTIHFENLGANFTSMMFTLNGETVKTLSRKTYSVGEIEELLFTYHMKFQIYFNKIIKEIIPDDYYETNVSLHEYYDVLKDMNKIQKKIKK